MKIKILSHCQAGKVYKGLVDLGPEWLELEVDAWETLELIRQEDQRIWTNDKAGKTGYYFEYVRDITRGDLRVKFTKTGCVGIIVGEIENPNLLMIHRIDIIRLD
jgi:hypothetical protein